MDENLLERLKRLRKHYDFALGVCDPIDFAQRQKDLVYAIAEHLIQPLQEHEMAERSKFNKDDEEEKIILDLANKEITMWRKRFLNNQLISRESSDKKTYVEHVFLATPVGGIDNAQYYYEKCLREYDEAEPS